MKNIRIVFVLIILPMISIYPLPAQVSATLDSVGQAILAGGDMVGFSIAIREGGELVYQRGFGFRDTAQTIPVTTDTRFLMASVSKLMGAVLIMKLAEEGKISLDQTLYELVPDFPNPDQARKITLRQMLSHTSGLPEYAEVIDTLFVRTGRDPGPEDIFAFFRNRPLNFEPGTNYSYCNSGYFLMGIAVERITGNSLQKEFNRVINQPTGTDLRLIREAADLPEMASYWERKEDSFIAYPHWRWIQGDGGLTATPSMLSRFPSLWANGMVISPASFEEMSTPVTLSNGVRTGYGIGVRNGEIFGEKIIGHTGGHKSTYSIMVYFPARELTFVVMMNTDASNTSVRRIFGEMARNYFGLPEPDLSGAGISNDHLSDYEGEYKAFDSKTNDVVEVVLKEDGQLHYCYRNDCEPMTFIGENKFWVAAWPYDLIVFEKDADGQFMALKEYYTGFYSILRSRRYE